MLLVLDGRYLGKKPSGIGNYIKALVTRLPQLDPDLRIRLWVRDAADVQELASDRVHLHRVRPAPNSAATLLAPWALDRLSAADVYHAPANVLGFGIACPSVVTVHDVMWLDRLSECQPNPWLRPISGAYFGAGIRHALRSAQRILTVSHASSAAIQQVEPSTAGRIVVTHNAPEAHFRPARDRQGARRSAAQLLGFDNDYFLVVGQNQPSKRHDVALRAFARCPSTDVRLVFVQRLSPGGALVRLATELGIRDRVHFASQLTLSQLITVMQSALALLQPSSMEGFGMPVLEAAACGCPVIASRIAPLQEVLGDAAIYAAAGDVAAWGDALCRMLVTTDLRENLARAGEARSHLFSWDRTAELTMDVYREAQAASARTA